MEMSIYQAEEFNSQIQNQCDSDETFVNLEKEAIEQYLPSRFSRHDMIFNNVVGYHYHYYGPSPFSIFQRYHSFSRGELALENPYKSESRHFHRGLLQGTRIKPSYSTWTLNHHNQLPPAAVDVQQHEEIENIKREQTYKSYTRTRPRSKSVRYENPIVKQFREAIWNINKTSSNENCDLGENKEENNMVAILSPRNIDEQSDEEDFATFLCKKGKGLGRKQFSSSSVINNHGIHNFQDYVKLNQ